MIKKVLKITGILFLALIIVAIAVPFVFGDTIKDKIKYLANEHVHAKVNFEDVDISLFRSFPKASVIIDDLSLINYAPFEGDTLAYIKKIALDVSMNELFASSSDPINVKRLLVDQALVAIKTDSLGNSNLDITKNNTPQEASETDGNSFTFELDHYELNDSKLLYKDDVSKTMLELSQINHTGDGVLAGNTITLDTHSGTLASLILDGTNYLNKNKLKLDAEIELDLENQRYTFKENQALINQLPLHFDGFVQLDENFTDVAIHFNTPTSDFKNFLAVIPASYAKNLEGVQTSGDFSIDGNVKGKVDDNHIPTMDIKILSHNASFKYPDLPKSVQNINIDTQIKNETGRTDDTYVNINNLTFRIDQDTFAAKGSLQHLTKNMVVDIIVNGSLNLANLNQVYPLALEEKLNGTLKANIDTKFDMESLDKEQYQNVKNSGTMSLTNFKYASTELPNEINISNANIRFTPEKITLEQLDAKTGKSDLAAQGNIQNLMGFLFTKQDLKGTFDVAADVFAVSDFMVADTETDQNTTNTEENEEALKIPSFLDATLNFKANKVFYDNIQLNQAKGTVQIKDETAYLKNITSTVFDGNIALNGNVSTKSKTPTFDMNMDLSKVNIIKSFNSLELLQNIAPIAKALNGALDTKINLTGNLSDDLTPVLKSLKGNALAKILNAKVNTAETPMLSQLDSKLDFITFNKLNLKDIKTKLDFDDGKVTVKPFDFDVQGIKVTASGNHSFESAMDYKLDVDIPAKYMGKELGGLLSQLSPQETNAMKVDLPIGITGNFSNPKINLNTGQAVKQLTNQIVAKQKNKVKDKVIGESSKVIGNLLGGSKNTQKASTGGTKPSTKQNLQNTAKNVLGGFLRKKKVDTTRGK